MADLHFAFKGRFAERARKRRVIEERVITKAIGSARRIEQNAFDNAREDLKQTAGGSQSYRAYEAGGAIGNTPHFLKDEAVVIVIGSVQAGVASGVNTGLLFERIDLKARIVGED